MSEIKTIIKDIPIEEIKPYWRNSRRGNVTATKESIKMYGYRELIVVDKDYIIIAGHTRYKALNELGYTTIKCIVAEDMPPEKVKEYRIADNKTSDMAVWDHEALSTELKTIKDHTNMIHFFTQEEIDSLIQKSIGVDYQGVTSSDIASSQNTLDNIIGKNYEKHRPKFIKLTCPKCEHEFDVSI